MTYQEALENNPNLITADIDDVLKQAIYDWFYDWQIFDDAKFGAYFNRVLNRDYERYQQMLRIQPGEAKYDWLVGNYMEKEVTSQGMTSGTSTTTSETIGTNAATTETSHTGTEKQSDTGTSSKTSNGTDTTDISGSETNTRTGSETDSATHGLGATKSTQSTKNNQSHKSETTGNDSQTGTTYTGQDSATKQGPMDASIASSGTTNGVPSVSVSYGGHASTIATSYNAQATSGSSSNSSTQTDSYSGDADTVTTSTNAVTNTDSGTKTYDSVKDTKEYVGREDKVTRSATESGTTGSDGTTTYDTKDTTTQTGSNNGTTTQNGTTSGSSSDTQHERFTGRTETPADIISRAVAFIQTTNAWEWLEARLEPLFIMVYDI